MPTNVHAPEHALPTGDAAARAPGRIRAAVDARRAGSALPDPTAPLRRDVPEATLARVLAQARSTPAAIAIRDAEGRDVNFGDLAAAARTLGRRLAAAGVGPGDVVAIHAVRSLSLPWAMLGTWCAGAAFCVLDAGYPPARLSAAIGVARPRAILTLGAASPLPDAVQEALREVSCAITIPLPPAPTSEWLEAGDAPCDVAALTEAQPAYVAFTSGTTGAPKGIVAGHAPLAHFLEWHARTFALASGDRFVLLAGLSHDPLLRSIFTPLTTGGTLLVPAPAMLREPAALRAFIAREGITVLHLTPSLSRLLAHGHERDDRHGTLRALRHVFFAGEPLYRSTVQLLRAVAPHAIAVNFFGATETPQAMGHWVIDPAAPDASDATATIPVGHGIDDVQLLIVDAQGNRVDVGTPGEICIRTAYLAQGYLGQPEETARKFVVNPATQDPTDLMYRTGDLGTYDATGAVTVLGRADRQLKVRGFRVELDEIEATIGQHPQVRHVAVNAEPPVNDADRRIVAHIAAGPELSAHALRSALRMSLPEYMIPSRITVLPSLPLTSNGKIDRAALDALPRADASPDHHASADTTTPAPAPRETEEALAAIWRDVLGVSQIARDDSFFDLGGNSLLGLDLLVRIEQVFGRQLATNTLMLAPTVAAMSELLRHDAAAPAQSLLVKIRDGGSQPPVFWLPGGGGLSVVAFRAISHRLDAERPVYGLEADLDVDHAPVTLPDIVRAYRLAIQQVQPHGPYHLLGFSLGSFVAYELAVQFRSAGEEVATLVVFDTEIPGAGSAIDRLRIAAHRAGIQLVEAMRRARTLTTIGGWMRQTAQAIARSVVPATAASGSVTSEPPSVFEIIRRRNVAAIHAYAAEPLMPFDGRVTCVLARDSSLHGLDQHVDPRLAWRHTATAGITTHTVNGTHLSMLEPPHVDQLAVVLRDVLAAG